MPLREGVRPLPAGTGAQAMAPGEFDVCGFPYLVPPPSLTTSFEVSAEDDAGWETKGNCWTQEFAGRYRSFTL